MQIQFKNRYIFFAVESIWDRLDYRFKYLLHQLVTENSEDEYVQNIDVPEAVLIECYKAVSAQPEGIATMNNEVMEADLMPQLFAVQNLHFNGEYFEPDYTEDIEEGEPVINVITPNEAGRIVLAIQEFKAHNKAVREAKILNGKTQILS